MAHRENEEEKDPQKGKTYMRNALEEKYLKDGNGGIQDCGTMTNP